MSEISCQHHDCAFALGAAANQWQPRQNKQNKSETLWLQRVKDCITTTRQPDIVSATASCKLPNNINKEKMLTVV